MYVCLCVSTLSTKHQTTPLQDRRIPQQGWSLLLKQKQILKNSDPMIQNLAKWDSMRRKNTINHKLTFHLIRYMLTTFTILVSNRLIEPSIIKASWLFNHKYKFAFYPTKYNQKNLMIITPLNSEVIYWLLSRQGSGLVTLVAAMPLSVVS